MDLQAKYDTAVTLLQRAVRVENLVARLCERVVKSPSARAALAQELAELKHLRPDLFPKAEADSE